jgi:hypothetical protein
MEKLTQMEQPSAVTDPSTYPSTQEGRLQRSPDFTGPKLDTFRQIFLRHGLPGLLLGLVVLLLLPGAPVLLLQSLDAPLNDPSRYLISTMVIFLGMVAFSIARNKSMTANQIGWIVYLGCLSVWEEWVFRVAGPHYLQLLGLGLIPAVVLSNVLFGVMHYFTLRWKWQWCLMAFLGGMAFSRQYQVEGSLLLIVGIHWVATFLNTPRSPGARSNEPAAATKQAEQKS